MVNADKSTSTYLFENVAGSDTEPRTFEIASMLSEVTDVENAQLVTFLDIDEDGRMDFLV